MGVALHPPVGGDDWVGFGHDPLPVDRVLAWSQLPSCGAVVVFAGTVRDHAPGRPDVAWLEYEAYEDHVVPRMRAIVAEARAQWPEVERVALVHRGGRLDVGDVSVVAVVSSPHRPEAFEAARFCIDTLKETVPIWKREAWSGGEDWSTCDHPLDEAGRAVSTP
jgi:molybdopterin synthase catalytic subunit